MPELKPLPCPACGSDTQVIKIERQNNKPPLFTCLCVKHPCQDREVFYVSEEAAIKAHNSLPRALRRTATPPTEDGQYYWALGMNLMWFVVRVVEINGEMYAMMPGSEVECPISDFVEWAGPITPPGE